MARSVVVLRFAQQKLHTHFDDLSSDLVDGGGDGDALSFYAVCRQRNKRSATHRKRFSFLWSIGPYVSVAVDKLSIQLSVRKHTRGRWTWQADMDLEMTDEISIFY